ncbi:hypothetical protein AX16_005287 [Volvariella volvacea WC 439]|nr:hypothetical protein AX16_005287 [Volvariella volvacea WC 439]
MRDLYLGFQKPSASTGRSGKGAEVEGGSYMKRAVDDQGVGSSKRSRIAPGGASIEMEVLEGATSAEVRVDETENDASGLVPDLRPFDFSRYTRKGGITARRPFQFQGGLGGTPSGIDGDPWSIPYQALEKHDNEMCQAWNDEIQNLLIFTGLFAATVTAFTVESYQWLESDPAETTAKMVTQISLQLANLSDPITHNPTLASSLSFDPEPRKSYAVGVNILWFLSLSVSLSTVLIGVLCLQWLREYKRDAQSMLPKDVISLRQLRYAGLTNWNVPAIISILPLFLQVAVVLFFIGLLQLLYELDRLVAAIIMPVILTVPLILIGTAVAPVFQVAFMFGKNPGTKSQCPYKSPQAWWCYRLLRLPLAWLMSALNQRDSAICAAFGKCDNWIELDECWEKEVHFFVSEPNPETEASGPSSVPLGVQASSGGRLGDKTLLKARVKYIRDAVLWTIETWGHRNDIFEMIRTMLPSLDKLELYFVAIHFDPSISHRHAPRMASGALVFDPDIRACVEFAILLFLPKSSWKMNQASAEYMMNQFKRCIARAPASFAVVVSFERLSNVLYQLYNELTIESFRQTLKTSLSSLVTLCYCWVETGVYKSDSWKGDHDPWLAHFTPKRLLWRFTLEVLSMTKAFKFLDDHEASEFGLRPGVSGEDGRLGPNLDEIEICLIALQMSRHSDSWDMADGNKYIEIVKSYAMSLSTAALDVLQSGGYKVFWKGKCEEGAMEWEWLVGLTLAPRCSKVINFYIITAVVTLPHGLVHH